MHPIKEILRRDGRKLCWLAEKVGYNRRYVSAILNDQFNPSPQFKAACARVLGIPEGDLFLPRTGRVHKYREAKRRTQEVA